MKRIDAEGRNFPGPQQGEGSEEDPYSPEDSLESPPGMCSPLELGSPMAVCGEHLKGAAASVLSPDPDAEPRGTLQVTDLEHLLEAP